MTNEQKAALNYIRRQARDGRARQDGIAIVFKTHQMESANRFMAAIYALNGELWSESTYYEPGMKQRTIELTVSCDDPNNQTVHSYLDLCIDNNGHFLKLKYDRKRAK